MRTVSALVLLASALASAQDKREVGALVLDGIPEIPKGVAQRMSQYQNTRGASLVDWLPDGKGLFVLTRFGETPQVHFVAGPGLDRQQVTFFDEPVRGAAVDPSAGAQGLLLAMDSGGGEFYQQHWFDRTTGRATMLSDGKSRNESPLFSRAGDRFAFVSTRRNGTDFDLYVQRRSEPAGARLVKELKGQWNPLDWSPDDKRLLVLRYVSVNESYLHVLDVETGAMTEVNPRGVAQLPVAFGTARWISNDAVLASCDEGGEFLQPVVYDLKPRRGPGGVVAVPPGVVVGKVPWDVTGLAVSRNLRSVALVYNEGGTSGLYVGAIAGLKVGVRRVDLPKGVVGSLAFEPKGARLAFSFNSATSPDDTWVLSPGAKKPVRWTFSEIGGLSAAAFVTPELIEYPSFDGMKIPAWYYRPAQGAKKPAPVIINIHGGPEGQSMAWFSSVAQYFANELGAATLYPNVRGSSGYGKTYLKLDNADKRMDSVKDIGALLDWIATQPDLDRTRVAVMGGSYGGFMSLASLAAYPDRIRCGVDVVGISHFVTFLEKTEGYRRDLRRAEYGDEREPKMRALLDSISPLTNAGKIRSPLFVAQGANDPRVPAAEAEQIVKTVRGNGGTVWYLLAKDEGHGFAKKKNRDAYLNATSLFFDRYLLQ